MRRISVSSHALILFGPVALAVLAGRLVETAVATSTMPEGGLWTLFVPLGLVLGVSLGVWALWVRAARPPAESLGVSVGLAAIFAVVTHAALPAWQKPWVSFAALAYVRLDLAAVAVLALVFLLALRAAPPRAVRLVLWLGRAVAVALTAVFVADAGYLLAVGAPLDGALARYTVGHLGLLVPVLVTEVSASAVALPVGLGAMVAASAWAARRRAAVPGTGALPPLALLLGAAALGLGAAPLPPQGMLVRLLAVDRAADRVGAAALAEAAESLDTRALTLVPTDSVCRHNVVVVVLESTRRRSTTPYTPALRTTPVLDSLARAGALVERMTTTVPHTNKALVSIFGGVYPYPGPETAPGADGWLPVRGLADLLGDAGYATAFMTPAEFAYERKDLIVRSLGFEDLAGATDHNVEGFEPKAYFGFEDRVVLAPALGWIDRHAAAGRPFLLGLLTLSAHHPYDTPPDWPLRDFGADDPEVEAYHNALAYQDAFLGALWRGIAARGLADETILVVVGDHGEAFGEHGFRTHGDAVWEEALEVPGVVVGPGVRPGTRVAGERSVLDVLPTVAGLLGYRLDGARLPGRSLFTEPDSARTLYHFTRSGNLSAAVRHGSTKTLTWWGRRPAQTYDLASDPGELSPLATAHADDEAALGRWRATVVAAYRHLAASR